MIHNLIFDLGGVLIDLDQLAVSRELAQIGCTEFSAEMHDKNLAYEKGFCSTRDFLAFYQAEFPEISQEEFIHSWNAIIGDFPQARLDFIQQLSDAGDYTMTLLSNTNDLHFKWISEKTPSFADFKRCFDRFYLSHKLHMRKPDIELYKFVLEEGNFHPPETLFIDDTAANIKAAERFGLHTWHFIPGKDDINQLHDKIAHLNNAPKR